MKKIINSAEREYQPVETQNLVLDDKATVGSFNGITSDAVARAVAGASGEVPEVTSSDNGKVLTAVYDEGGPAVEWAEAQGGLPSSTWSDSGKVLTVDSQGAPAWATLPSSAAWFNTTFDLIDSGNHVAWFAYVQQSSTPAPTIDLPEGVYAYRVEAFLIASAAVDDVYNIEVHVGNGDGPKDCKAVGLQSDRDNAVSILSSGIIQIVSGAGISKSRIFVTVSPAKSSGASSAVFPQGSVQLKLARL